ncbi:MAG: hypothetical protein HYY06_08580 [Deltaproteobacteria bacterium]|nr:hypothetical protein [Deltaproteobacteria bacterium]
MRAWRLVFLVLASGWVGCAPAAGGGGDDDDSGGGDGDGDVDGDTDTDADNDGDLDRPPEIPEPDPDAFFADDPPPQYCGPDGNAVDPPEPPGGTPECPDDKNREGCPCETVGEEAPCWPGMRVNRDRGICHDGTTVCEPFNEFYGAWGPCEDYVIPEEGARLGPEACMCFSEGRWEIDNLSPCFVVYPDGTYAVSSYMGAGGQATCPTPPNNPPPEPQPGEDWSTNRLTVDCAGQFELCYALRAGDAENPTDQDCVVASICTEAWYEEAGVEEELPPLPGWSGDDPDCAERFAQDGGYGEMSVVGLSVECDEISDDGDPYVFNRVPYCPLDCNERPNDADCVNCGQGGSGSF